MWLCAGCSPYIDESSDQCAALASERIAQALDGGRGVQVPCATVTFVRPAYEADPDGLFAQAQADGPGLYLEIPFADLQAGFGFVPEQGQLIGFQIFGDVVTENEVRRKVVSVSQLVDFGPSPKSIAELTVDQTDNPLIYDDRRKLDYTLATGTGRLDSWFGGSQQGFVGAGFNPMALQSAINAFFPVKLRVPNVTQDTYGLVQSCFVNVGPTPLWPAPGNAPGYDLLHFTAWDEAQLEVLECPRAQVFATRTGDDQVELELRVPPAIIEPFLSDVHWPTRWWGEGAETPTHYTVDGITPTAVTAHEATVTLTVPGLAADAPLQLELPEVGSRDIIGQFVEAGSRPAPP